MDLLSNDFSIDNYTHKSVNEAVEDSVNWGAVHRINTDMDEKAKDWGIENDRIIIYDPAIDDALKKSGIIDIRDRLQKLEDMWIEYNMMLLKNRRESDWKAIELYGIDNRKKYEFLKAILGHFNDISYDPMDINEYKMAEDSVMREAVEDSVDWDAVHFPYDKVEEAIEWMYETGFVIIVPPFENTLESLEDSWTNYNMMLLKHRRVSDWRCMELFGITNLQAYTFLKAVYLGLDLRKTKSLTENSIDRDMMSIKFNDPTIYIRKYMNGIVQESTTDLLGTVLESTFNIGDKYQERIVNNIISDALRNKDTELFDINSAFIPYGELPYFTPDEMIDFGVYAPIDKDNYFGVASDNHLLEDMNTKEWFENYQYNFNGFDTEAREGMAAKWINTVRKLTRELAILKEQDADKTLINSKMQSILELGWNPFIKFTNENRVLATKRLRTIIESKCIKSNIVDIRSITFTEATHNIDNELYPVYITLIEDKTSITRLVRLFTGSVYTHAGISLDNKFDKIYSFGMHNKESEILGGFTIEDISRYKKENPIAIYTIFLKKDSFIQIQNMIKHFEEHSSEFAYSYLNLISNIFNIPFNRKNNFVCSQFVDRILKLSDIDITNKDSSLVTPADLREAEKNNRNIYLLYEGKLKDINLKNIANAVNNLMQTSRPIKESRYISNDYEFMILLKENIHDYNKLCELSTYANHRLKDGALNEVYTKYLVPMLKVNPILVESKSLNIEFDKDGNLVWKNLSKLDINTEYDTSHKLLMSYDRDSNINGMKYEIAKLWMLYSLLEDRLKQPSKFDKKETLDSKARVLNDFKKYLTVIQNEDKEFVFSTYYEESPFNTSKKISANTLKFGSQLIKTIIRA